MKEKQCFKCKLTKSLDEFYKHKEMNDGCLNKCKDCTKKDVKERYYSEEGFKKIQEYERRRFKTKHRKEKIREYQKKRRKKYPEKARARHTLSNAIRDKRIFRKPCEICGNKKSEGHHKDYKKPLDVKWLCKKHHFAEHRKLKNKEL